jgi:drug/metabolite transporter (DMT)-like permease
VRLPPLFFFAVKHVPVAEAISVTFVAPLAVVLLAWPLLGERITLFRLAAVVVGFSGVPIVIRPGSAVFQWASVLLLGSAMCYAFYQILTRRLAGIDQPAASIFYSVMGALLMLLWLPFVWKVPGVWPDWALLCSLGVIGALGHYCVAKAMTYASANFVAPFNYTQMIGSRGLLHVRRSAGPLYVARYCGDRRCGLMVSWQGRKRQKS